MDIFHKTLVKYWGYTKFRPLQHEIITSVSEGNDTLALMPTGGGKSITFQVPALSKEGLCIVVTPLIALMKDQVENLNSRGIKATAVYSGMTKHEIDIALDNCIYDSGIKFLYCSPERLSTELFRVRLQQMNVNLLAIDEAHCISQWGYDFRPSYLNIAEIRKIIPDVPVLAVTATATPQVIKDIQEKLIFKKENVFKMSFERKNLVYLVRNTENKNQYLLRIINSIKNGSGIIYVRNRLKTKETALLLQQNNISADYYHAGLAHTERESKQNMWKQGKTRVMVATNAFGMGIDKADVRFVVHLDLPDTLEAYFQEAGRAGRDGKQAFAVLLFHPSDKTKLKKRIESNFPPLKDIRRVYEALGNYFQLPVGAGRGMSFDFDMSEFVKRYRFSILLVYNSLRLLQQSGYLELSEEINNPSRLIFLVERDYLYKYQVANAKEDIFIKLLLRTYSGLFSSYRAIDENTLAKKAGTTGKVIYEYLKKLSRDKIINYIPRKQFPQIFYPEERLKAESVIFSQEKYLKRKELFEKNISAVIKYATHNKCRSQQLLNYFGDEKASRCGVCDVCSTRNKLNLSKYEFDLILEQIKKIVSENTVTEKNIVEKVTLSQEKTIKVIRWLLDNNKIIKDENMLLKWNTTKE